MGPLTNTQKITEEFPDVDFYILKPEITGKQSKDLSKNAKKNNLLKTKRGLSTQIYAK